LESISLVQANLNRTHYVDDWIEAHKPAVYMPMIETADIVARRYGIARERKDSWALESQKRIAAAQREGRLDAEIVPLPTVKAVTDKDTGAVARQEGTLTRGEG